MQTSPDPQIIDDFKPLPPPIHKSPPVKQDDDESNWYQHPTNSDVEINKVTGKFRTKNFSLKHL